MTDAGSWPMAGLGAALLLLVVGVAIPVGVLWLQVLAAVLMRTRPQPAAGGPRPPIAVLVPAHDEALVLGATLACLVPQLLPGDRLLVVADNCSDATADIARAGGAEVVERHNATLRGKGYALDHGVRHLAALDVGTPEVVVIVDADCHVAPGAIDTVVRCCQRTGRPVQALYLMDLPAGGGGSVSPIAALAWRVKNLVRPLGMLHLGLPCHLMGSGMAVPWRLLHDLPLASGHIVEDMKMGVDLARRGFPPVFCPEALVTSTFPISRQGAVTQRTRWEHGHLGMILSEVPRMLRDAGRPGSSGLVPLALDLAVPPQSLLLMLVMVTVTLSAIWAVLGLGELPLILSLGVLAMFAACLLVSWGRYARDVVSLGALLGLPWYVLSKLPVYLGFIRRRQQAWVRSSRERDQ